MQSVIPRESNYGNSRQRRPRQVEILVLLLPGRYWAAPQEIHEGDGPEKRTDYWRRFEESEYLGKRDNATEEQIKKVISETLARVTGKRVYDPTVREWVGKWLVTVSDATLTCYRQAVADFLDGIRPVAKSTLGGGHK
jgi:hypothetical protein